MHQPRERKNLTDLPEKEVNTIIDLALAEDTGHGDITCEVLIPRELTGKAQIIAKAEGILAGGEIARNIFLKVDSSIQFNLLIRDGTKLKRSDIIAEVSGRVESILKAERVVLNFLQRLSGIASLAAKYVAKAGPYGTVILDTRKTTPGLRALEKYAVRMGGGRNHRLDLGDGILIKDNHLAALRATGMTLKEIVTQARQRAPEGVTVEVEVTTADEAAEAVETRADIIMLDNMAPEEMGRVVKMIPGNIVTEASGGVNLDNIEAVARTGVKTISIGAMTHSPRALDISLELLPESIRLSAVG